MNEMTNSHIMVSKFDYHEPASIEEAISLLRKYGERARPLAGGTDLLVQMKMERFAPLHLISLSSIQGLDNITIRHDGLEIGALTSIRAIAQDTNIRSFFHALAEACESFSTTQIQIMGTLGGNLCNASPASDSAPALIIHNALAIIEGPGGIRSIPVEDFFLGPAVSALKKGELLKAIQLPWPVLNNGDVFLKVSRVAADIAKVNVAAILERNGDRIRSCRLAYGSVAPTPRRARSAEAVLEGQLFNQELVAEAAQTAAEEMAPIDDIRSSAWYRREIVRVLAVDVLTQAWERAPQTSLEFSPPSDGSTVKDSSKAARRESIHAISSEKIQIDLTVNGEHHSLLVSPNDLLINTLREQLNLTGAKYGCGIGECGACTIEIDGEPALACLVLSVSARDREILTAEGINEPDGKLHPLQEAFIEHAAYQCGYCTPGFVMTAKGLLAENPTPNEEEVRSYLKGNLCRCTGYASIVRAIMSSTDEAQGGND